jgi:hypothetical protein
LKTFPFLRNEFAFTVVDMGERAEAVDLQIRRGRDPNRAQPAFCPGIKRAGSSLEVRGLSRAFGLPRHAAIWHLDSHKSCRLRGARSKKDTSQASCIAIDGGARALPSRRLLQYSNCADQRHWPTSSRYSKHQYVQRLARELNNEMYLSRDI